MKRKVSLMVKIAMAFFILINVSYAQEENIIVIEESVECDLQISTDLKNVTCYAGSDGKITVTVTNGVEPYSYKWCTDEVWHEISGLKADSYHVTITDGLGCTVVDTFKITQPNKIRINEVVTNVSCNGGSDGKIITTKINNGTVPYSYLWNNGTTSKELLNLQSGTYTLTVTDLNGCNAQKNYTISQPDAVSIQFSIKNPLCVGDSNGSINTTVIGGTTPYTYNWSTQAITEGISNIPANTYSVSVTDAQGCYIEGEVALVDPIAMQITPTVTNLKCFGENEGSVNVEVIGGKAPYSYKWNNGALTPNINFLAAGEYTLVCTDMNMCSTIIEVDVTSPERLEYYGDVYNEVCGNGANASITMVVEGGTKPYNFSWNNGSTEQSIYHLITGNYVLHIEDANGCHGEDEFEVVSTPDVELSLYSPKLMGEYNTSCNPDGDGEIYLEVLSATEPYSITWSNGLTNETFISGLVAGTYSVEVEDSYGCSARSTITLTRPENCNCNPVIPTPSVNCSKATMVIDNMTWANIPAGKIAAINNTYNSGINMNGATLVICGTANVSSFNFNGANKIIVIGTLIAPNFSLNSSNIVIENYGKIIVDNWCGMGGTIYNYSNMFYNGGLNINPQGKFYNNGNLYIPGALNNNGIFVNNGFMSVKNPSHINSGCSFINNCTIEFADVIINSNLYFENNGSFTASTTRFNVTNVFFGSGSLVQTKNLYYNETIMTNRNSASCNMIIVTGRTEINGGTLAGKITLCDQNGIEMNNRLILKNGASLDCNKCASPGILTIKSGEEVDSNESNETEFSKVLSVYPSPVEQGNTINIEFDSESYSLMIVNTLGQIEYVSSYNSGSVEVQTAILSKGIVIVKAVDNITGELKELSVVVK